MKKAMLWGICALGLSVVQVGFAETTESQDSLPVVRMDQKHISVPGVGDVILVQTEDTPRKVFVDKSCTKSRDICLERSERYTCRTEWRSVCHHYPYYQCWSEPVTICGWETYCSRWGKQYYTANKDVRLIFNRDARIHFGQEERQFVLSCGSPDTQRVFLTPMAGDVRIKRGFWRKNTFKIRAGSQSASHLPWAEDPITESEENSSQVDDESEDSAFGADTE